jgi:hypothetical protein
VLTSRTRDLPNHVPKCRHFALVVSHAEQFVAPTPNTRSTAVGRTRVNVVEPSAPARRNPASPAQIPIEHC